MRNSDHWSELRIAVGGSSWQDDEIEYRSLRGQVCDCGDWAHSKSGIVPSESFKSRLQESAPGVGSGTRSLCLGQTLIGPDDVVASARRVAGGERDEKALQKRCSAFSCRDLELLEL